MVTMLDYDLLLYQSLGKGGKKVIVSDEWRSYSVEKRLEHSLIKVLILYY